jgi:hypothetical protein
MRFEDGVLHGFTTIRDEKHALEDYILKEYTLLMDG